MSKRFVYGAYSTLDEAEIVADDLMAQGVSENSISIIANHTSDVTTTSNYPVTLVTHEENPDTEKSWWDNLLGFFTDDQNDLTDETLGNDYSEYLSALREGQYLLVLDKSYDNLIESNGAMDSDHNNPLTAEPEERTGRHFGANIMDTDNTHHTDMSLSNEARATEIEKHQVAHDDTGITLDPNMPVTGMPIKSNTIAEDLMNDPDVPEPHPEDSSKPKNPAE